MKIRYYPHSPYFVEPPVMQITLQKTVKPLFLAIALILLAGCQYLKFPGVYKMNIQQGNIITQDMVNQLEPGMTKRQVRYVMGNPLIQDTFNPDRWDYFYSLTDARQNFTKERMTIYFENDQLVGFNGDYLPGNSQQAPKKGSPKLLPVPNASNDALFEEEPTISEK